SGCRSTIVQFWNPISRCGSMRLVNLGGRRSKVGVISPLGTTSHAFTVGVIVYSRCMGGTADAAGESADTGTYRRARARASGQRSDASAQQRTASRSAEHLPIPAVSARILLRVSIAVDRRGLGTKLFSAEHPKNRHPTHDDENFAVNHSHPSLVPLLVLQIKARLSISPTVCMPSIQKRLGLQTYA